MIPTKPVADDCYDLRLESPNPSCTENGGRSESTAPVFSDAIVLDNRSGDPTFIQGVDDSLGAP